MVLHSASGHESHRAASVVGSAVAYLAVSAAVASIIMLVTGLTTTGMSAVCVQDQGGGCVFGCVCGGVFGCV